MLYFQDCGSQTCIPGTQVVGVHKQHLEETPLRQIVLQYLVLYTNCVSNRPRHDLLVVAAAMQSNVCPNLETHACSAVHMWVAHAEGEGMVSNTFGGMRRLATCRPGSQLTAGSCGQGELEPCPYIPPLHSLLATSK